MSFILDWRDGESVERLPIRRGLWPALHEGILEEKDGRAFIDDGMGGQYICTTETSSPPHYIRHPFKNREDWEQLKPFFSSNTPGRFPLNWNEVSTHYSEHDYPLGMRGRSLYGWLRNWMGVKNISIAFYKDPDWIIEMINTLTDLWITIIRKARRSIQVDFTMWWEDICYSWGPLLSIHLLQEFMVPRYNRVTNVLKEYGVEINLLDSDGDITPLVPGWLEAGINCMYPVETRYTDIYALRENYGSRVLIMGGVNKFSLIAGKKTIQKELKNLTPLLKEGGYIPTIDHRGSPEISYSRYRYYLPKERVDWTKHLIEMS